MLAQHMSIWGRVDPPGGGGGGGGGGGKLCTYLQGRIGSTQKPNMSCPFQLQSSGLLSIVHFRMRQPLLANEQGRIGLLQVPGHLDRCRFCVAGAVGDKPHRQHYRWPSH